MATLLKLVASGIIGVILGLLVTIWSLDSDARSTIAGPWRGAPREGAADIDPYTLASVDRSGLLPLGASEGVTFFAQTDSAGASLSPACAYIVTGAIPAARFWTLSAATPAGYPIANPAQRYGFTSAEVLRQSQQPVAIVVAPEAWAGNWLPIQKSTPYVLVLRLYDMSFNAADAAFDASAMPAIRKLECSP